MRVDERFAVGPDRQPTTLVGVEHDALQINFLATGSSGVRRVEVSDFLQHFLCPITACGVLRKAEAIGKQHGMGGHSLGSLEILFQQGRGHDQCLTGVHETFPGSAVSGEPC